MAPCGAVGGGDVVAVAVHPQKLTSEIHYEFYWNEWGSLLYLSCVLKCFGVFCDWDNQRFGSERFLSQRWCNEEKEEQESEETLFEVGIIHCYGN